jgi:pyridoxine 4-dehydrogenase
VAARARAQRLLIPGTADPAHLADNMTIGSITLDAATLAALEA